MDVAYNPFHFNAAKKIEGGGEVGLLKESTLYNTCLLLRMLQILVSRQQIYFSKKIVKINTFDDNNIFVSENKYLFSLPYYSWDINYRPTQYFKHPLLKKKHLSKCAF